MRVGLAVSMEGKGGRWKRGRVNGAEGEGWRVQEGNRGTMGWRKKDKIWRVKEGDRRSKRVEG